MATLYSFSRDGVACKAWNIYCPALYRLCVLTPHVASHLPLYMAGFGEEPMAQTRLIPPTKFKPGISAYLDNLSWRRPFTPAGQEQANVKLSTPWTHLTSLGGRARLRTGGHRGHRSREREAGLQIKAHAEAPGTSVMEVTCSFWWLLFISVKIGFLLLEAWFPSDSESMIFFPPLP